RVSSTASQFFVSDTFLIENNDFFHSSPGQSVIAYAITDSSRQVQPLSSWETDYPLYFRQNLEVDPKVVNAAGHDFNLQAQSPLVDAGTFLAKTVSAGSGTTLVVDDAYPFFDGFGIDGEVGDMVQLQNSGQTARLTNVNYATNTLTLDASLSWTAGQGVSLPYNGNAPDIGAVESLYAQAGGPSNSFYVSPIACSDTGNGTLQNPLCTVKEGLKRIGQGQTLYIRSGTYTENILITDINSGTIGAPILIKNYNNENVTIKGDWIPGSGSSSKGFVFPGGKNYITIEGLAISNYQECLRFNNNDNLTLKNLDIHDCRLGIRFDNGSDNGILQSIKTYRISDPGDGANGHSGIECYDSDNMSISKAESYLNNDGGVDADGIHLELCDNITVTDANVYNNAEDGFDITGNGITLNRIRSENNAAVGIKALGRDATSVITVHNAIVTANGENGIKIDGTAATISNAILYANHEDGLRINAYVGGTLVQKVQNTIIANNNTLGSYKGFFFEPAGN
ncbi:MAG: right-handed parallel beta-helix repeat-containing protein, partial [Candidatus Diapherotrites archaeon]|nr:right-handed parallel beta-helix repeat-containing protein [Candidatus Diapherotrites archaeon]